MTFKNQRFTVALVALSLVAFGCGTDAGSVSISTSARSQSTTTASTPPPETPAPESPTSSVATSAPPATSTPVQALSRDGRGYPTRPTEPDVIAADIAMVEQALRDPATPTADLAELGHRQQVLIRHLGRNEQWDADVLAATPPDLVPIVELQLLARRSFFGLHTGYSTHLPAWRIVEPEPLEDLLSYYKEGEELTGIEWEYLAAINLVETGMGRIQGLSTAGAQGPMQFIPTTWDEVGEGDINDPHDAIVAAARYLDRRGGPEDMRKALYGYNNSDFYVDGVSYYADLLRLDPSALTGLYHWEIHFTSELGDLWLPVGYEYTEPILIEDYLAEHPESL